jgi:hypothetical protein
MHISMVKIKKARVISYDKLICVIYPNYGRLMAMVPSIFNLRQMIVDHYWH